MDTTQLDVLYNLLINLDEIAGECDEENNATIDRERAKIRKQICELELDKVT